MPCHSSSGSRHHECVHSKNRYLKKFSDEAPCPFRSPCGMRGLQTRSRSDSGRRCRGTHRRYSYWRGIGKWPKSMLCRQVVMNHPEPTADARLRHFLCHRQGHFDADMHAWLQQIAGDDARAIVIEAETGQPPPMLQLALHCASQTLKDEITNQPGFALQFLERATPACDSLRSRYLQVWVAELMDLARSAVARYVADSVLTELIKPR